MTAGETHYSTMGRWRPREGGARRVNAQGDAGIDWWLEGNRLVVGRESIGGWKGIDWWLEGLGAASEG